MFVNSVGSPALLVPDFTLPAAMPGTGQFVSPFPDGNTGFTQITLLQFVGVTAGTILACRVPPGGAAVAGNAFLYLMPILASQTLEMFYDTMNVLPAGYSLFFQATAGTVNCSVHGLNWS